MTLRGGARIEYKSDSNQFYGLANLYINTLDSWKITFESETFSDSKGTVLAEIGFGGVLIRDTLQDIFPKLKVVFRYKKSLKISRKNVVREYAGKLI